MNDIRLVGMVVIRNEADRYLKQSLAHHMQICDDVVVYDDQSEDDSVSIAKKLGCQVHVRPDNVPSLLDHEAAFRGAAWECLDKYMGSGAAVLGFDADEFLSRNPPGDIRQEVEHVLYRAKADGCQGVSLPMVEVFGFTDSMIPLVRTDGFWSTIRGVRLAWYTAGRFADRKLGGGSMPYQFIHNATNKSQCLSLLHLGYASWEDRAAKYERYKRHSGHNPVHIESIMQEPTLMEWNGLLPDIR